MKKMKFWQKTTTLLICREHYRKFEKAKLFWKCGQSNSAKIDWRRIDIEMLQNVEWRRLLFTRVACYLQETRSFEKCPETDEQNFLTKINPKLSHGEVLVHTELLPNFMNNGIEGQCWALTNSVKIQEFSPLPVNINSSLTNFFL